LATEIPATIASVQRIDAGSPPFSFNGCFMPQR
jgi:hypothetical protein